MGMKRRPYSCACGEKDETKFYEKTTGKCRKCCSAARLLWGKEHRARQMVAAAKGRAKRDSVPFGLDEEDVAFVAVALESGICALSGLKFEIPPKGKGPYTPSLDRIEPNKGYVKGNIKHKFQT